jgi:biopolymer transport protein ExbB
VNSALNHIAVLGQTDSSAAQTFYRQFFIEGGPIVWFILLPMSVVTVYLALDLLVTIRRKRLLPAGVATEIATYALRNGLTALPEKLHGRKDLLSRAILRAMQQGRQLGASSEMIRQWTAESLAESGMRLMRKAQWCQIIGSVAPMVGLFGTVFGMIRAFNLLGQGAEGPRYELLAVAISMALVTTFWGLLVAIPALFLYGVFQTRIEAFVSEASLEAEAVLGRILVNGHAKGFKTPPTAVPIAEPAAAKPKRVPVSQARTAKTKQAPKPKAKTAQ